MTTIKLRRSSTPGSVPTTSALQLGEVALNTSDGLLFFKRSIGGGIDSIVALSPTQLTNGSYSATLDSTGTFNTGVTALVDPSQTTSNYTLKITGYNGLGSTFAVGTGTETFGVANDALNHDFSGYVPYQVTASKISLKTASGPYGWTFNADGTTQFPNYKFPLAKGTAGQVLQTDVDGNLTWQSVTLPSVTGHGGSYLVTDGSTVSWSSIPAQNVLTNGSYTLSLGNTGNVTAPGDILVNNLSVKDNITKTLFWYQDGNLTNKVGTVRWYASAPLTMTGIVSRISTASDANITLQIVKNGSIIYTVSILSGTYKTTTAANFTMNTDDYVTVNITSVGSNANPGVGLSVQFTYYFN
jgi:hypothetical protein